MWHIPTVPSWKCAGRLFCSIQWISRGTEHCSMKSRNVRSPLSSTASFQFDSSFPYNYSKMWMALKEIDTQACALAFPHCFCSSWCWARLKTLYVKVLWNACEENEKARGTLETEQCRNKRMRGVSEQCIMCWHHPLTGSSFHVTRRQPGRTTSGGQKKKRCPQRCPGAAASAPYVTLSVGLINEPQAPMSPPHRDIADQYSHEISLRSTLITAACRSAGVVRWLKRSDESSECYYIGSGVV